MKQANYLLIQDLCNRIPYHPILKIKNIEGNIREVPLGYGNIGYIEKLGRDWWVECKPYLRLLTSMTKKEREELNTIANGVFEISEGGVEIWSKDFMVNDSTIINPYARPYKQNCLVSSTSCFKLIDWLNAHHFDYRGLIRKGLALPARKRMYNINNL